MAKEQARLAFQTSDPLNRLERMLREGTPGRRDFLQAFAALGLGGFAAGHLAFDAAKVVAATPKRGGRLRAAMAQHGPDDTLDPAQFKAGIDYCRGFQIYNTLIDLDDRLTPRPALAESWEPNTDVTSWVFKLRSGVEFHNGKSFSAADVVYSMRRHLDDSVGSTGKSFLDDVSEIVAEDDRTVRFTLKGPNADFPVNLGVFQMFIVPDGHTDFNGDPVGTGPFVMKEFKPGIRSLTTRNANYWRESRPYLDEIEWFGITDPVARLNALLSGDIQVMAELSAKSIQDVENAAGVRVLATKAGQFVNVVMMRNQPPFDNLDAVTGIKYLFDREKIMKRIFKEHGLIGNDHPISPVDPMYCEALAIRAYDPDKAKFHLSKAGLLNSSITLFASEAAHANAVDVALALQREARKIGLTIKVNRAPAAGYWSDVWMKKAMHMSGWNMRPTANVMLSLAMHSKAKWNESRFVNSRFDKLLVEARGVTDIAKRKEMYCEMLQIAHDEAGLGLPAFVDYLDAVSDKVQGVPGVPLGPLGGYSFPEHVWLDT